MAKSPPSKKASSSAPSSASGRWLRRLVYFVVGLLLLLVVGFGILRYLVSQTPTFYSNRLNPGVAKPGSDLESKLLDFRNHLRTPGTWMATFQEEAINQWLANDLPSKFPSALPAVLSEPRIELGADRILLGVRLNSMWVPGVLWLEARMEMDSQPNTVAVHLDKAQIGSLSLPVSYLEKQVDQAVRSQNYSCRWVDDDLGRVLLITIPKQKLVVEHGQCQLEKVSLEDKSLSLTMKSDFRMP